MVISALLRAGPSSRVATSWINAACRVVHTNVILLVLVRGGSMGRCGSRRLVEEEGEEGRREDTDDCAMSIVSWEGIDPVRRKCSSICGRAAAIPVPPAMRMTFSKVWSSIAQ